MSRLRLLTFLCLLCAVNAFAGDFSASTRLALARASREALRAPAGNAADGRTLQAFIEIDSSDALSMLDNLGVVVRSVAGNIVTAEVPLRAFEALAGSKAVRRVSVARRMTLCNDLARQLTGIDEVCASYAEKGIGEGRGVIVGLIDCGFDFNHIAFLDSLGKSRLERVYLPCVEGVAPVVDGIALPGSVYTPDEIPTLTTDDATMTHGTHTAGTAAGGFRGKAYRGMAGDASLVLCGVLADSLTDFHIANSLRYIFAYADSVQRPCVVNMSFGDHEGAHDGTSTLCRLFDELSGKGKICVVSAGNDGERPMHMKRSFTSETDTLRTMVADWNANSKVSGYVSMWSGTELPRFRVFVTNRNTGEVLYRLPWLDGEETLMVDSDNDSIFATYFSGTVEVAAEIAENHSQRIVAFDITPNSQEYRIALELCGEGTRVEMWSAPYLYMTRYGLAGYQSGNTDMTISDLGTSDNAISVGAYCSRSRVKGVDGTITFTRSRPYSLAYYSSGGYDVNGKMRPDVLAPGLAVVSSGNRYCQKLTNVVDIQTFDDDDYPYFANTGTSMSAPVVTGAIALWLQLNPTLDAAAVRQLLSETCVIDEYVTSATRSRWGYGKLDAAAGMRRLLEMERLRCDVNHDGVVNVTDVNLLVSAALTSTVPDGYDINGDGTVNVTDINLAVSAVLATTPAQ